MEVRAFELPDDLKPVFKRAVKLEWVTFIYISSVVGIMYMVMGSSQAMKSALLEDILSAVPSLCFLISARIFNKQPNEQFPYGYHRVYSIAFLTGAIALLSIGGFILTDSVITLVKADRPTIGSISIFGKQVWMGWIMIVALAYSSIPSVILGLMKMPLAKKLHNKILYTDADTQKADYMTAFAAMGGIAGIWAGWWWADATAAIIISFSIVNDGVKNVKTAVLDLMDRTPVKTENAEPNPIIAEVEELVKTWHWVQDAKVRFREHGQVFFGEVYIVTAREDNLAWHKTQAIKDIQHYHWKLHDVTISIVQQLPDLKSPQTKIT